MQGSGNLSLSNTAAAAVTLNVGGNNASTIFSGNLSGGSLTKIGAGTLTLSGNVTLAGTATVSGGAVNQSAGYLQGPAVVVDGGAYNLSGTGIILATSEYVGCAGSGAFNQSGGTNMITDALYLGTNPGSNGSYNLVGGLLVVSSILQGSGSSPLNISGGSLTGLGNGITFSLPIVLAASGGSTFDTASSSLTVDGPVSGNGALIKTGPGTLVLSGPDSYRGGTYVYAWHAGRVQRERPRRGDQFDRRCSTGQRPSVLRPAPCRGRRRWRLRPARSRFPNRPLVLLAVGSLLAFAACWRRNSKFGRVKWTVVGLALAWRLLVATHEHGQLRSPGAMQPRLRTGTRLPTGAARCRAARILAFSRPLRTIRSPPLRRLPPLVESGTSAPATSRSVERVP